ncbi:hypothetical protein IKD57_03590 [Candidatus Saccharibacteria bacterium]|nr:hypothetical protein [Candidatus Saccharibacteria bacterium]
MNDNNLVTPQQTQATPSTSGEPAKKKSKGVIATMTILSVLTIAGIGVSVFALVDSNSKSNHISDLEKDIANKTQEINNCKSAADDTNDTNDKSDKSDSPTPGCSTNGVDFSTYATNLLNSIKSLNTKELYKYITTRINTRSSEEQIIVSAYINSNADLIYNTPGGNSFTIASNVIDVEFIHSGNGNVNDRLYFINQDGSVSATENLYNLKENTAPSIVNNVGDLKEIISIIQTNSSCFPGDTCNGYNGLYAVATDIHGVIHKTPFLE